ALELDRRIGWTAADRLRGDDAVERFALEMIPDVLRRVLFGAPAGVALVADVHVNVDHSRDDRLAAQSDARSAGRYRDAILTADGGDAAVLDNERSAVDWSAPVADDQTPAFVRDRGRASA